MLLRSFPRAGQWRLGRLSSPTMGQGSRVMSLRMWSCLKTPILVEDAVEKDIIRGGTMGWLSGGGGRKERGRLRIWRLVIGAWSTREG